MNGQYIAQSDAEGVIYHAWRPVVEAVAQGAPPAASWGESSMKCGRFKRPWRWLALLAIVIVAGAGVFLAVDSGARDSVSRGALRFLPLPPPVRVDRVLAGHDEDGDGHDDLEDFVVAARAYVAQEPRYRDGYYQGGYPPPGVGVCTDVVWAGLAGAGYDLKAMVDEDIRRHPEAYPRVGGRSDPNIDFRRVQNLCAFFSRRGTSLTTEVRPGDAVNLRQWQGGDIVAFGGRYEHIAVVSDRRRRDGVPYLLHNAGPWATEGDALTTWSGPIIGHYRFPPPAR